MPYRIWGYGGAPEWPWPSNSRVPRWACPRALPARPDGASTAHHGQASPKRRAARGRQNGRPWRQSVVRFDASRWRRSCCLRPMHQQGTTPMPRRSSCPVGKPCSVDAATARRRHLGFRQCHGAGPGCGALALGAAVALTSAHLHEEGWTGRVRRQPGTHASQDQADQRQAGPVDGNRNRQFSGPVFGRTGCT